MSSDQEFFIKINDIIGKTWLATLDDSGGYVLSLKPIEQNNSSPVLPETEKPEKNILLENNLPNIPSSENPEKKLNQSTNGDSESPEESNAIKKELCLEFNRNLRTQENCQDFVEQINNNNNLIDSDILPIRYEELRGKLLSEKMISLIQIFRERGKIKQLQQVYYICKKFKSL
ncbi:MAG: hypothetical protein RMY64_04860 [Nostoc sp. DedQUE08]|uniref:hypothetical protein n=1 Tax=unclassified Nostoc TaxID=2593658 RepID=UPI002AD448D5|nr:MULTISPECIES: hypothetical protein [unclassified Nostoc]MDZ8030067.1 hypothetical protein [Nostoc sp. DedSLP04]MDZ8064959.1 hypothetical protein [Nostoc sp. DedQUE08]